MANRLWIVRNPDTSNDIELSMSEEDYFASQLNPQIIRDKLVAKAATEADRQLDLAELATAKAEAALGDIKDVDLVAVNGALNAWATASNAQKLDMIQTMLQVQRRILQRQQGIIKVLKRLVN